MSKNLYDIAKRALDEADDDYDDGLIECGEIPEKANEILQHKLDCKGQYVYCRTFWLEDKDSDLDTALSEMIGFCIKHRAVITDYTVVYYDYQDFVFVVFLSNEPIDE